MSLNNPLAVIKGYLELILGHHELTPQTRADLEKVAHESNRAAKLVSTFLAFARPQPVKHQTVHLNALIHKIVELRKPELDKCGVELLLDLAPQLPSTRANADQIEQVLLNLLNNALQAMPGSGRPPRLRISTECASGLIQVIVEDSGPGVPKHLEAKIFEPFFTTKDVGTGTGLGLSLAHAIMSEQRGRISFRPSSLGGAGFLLEFPVAEPNSDEVSAEEKALSLDHEEWQTETMPQAIILVLDDERPLAEMLGQMLTVIGHQPVLCHLPLKALELLEERDFDLILSDYRMPGLDGQQFYRMVTQKKPALAQRFVFLTGDVANEETYKFLNSIGAPHLTKPFQLASVEKVIAAVLHSAKQGKLPAAAPTI